LHVSVQDHDNDNGRRPLIADGAGAFSLKDARFC